MEDNRMTGFQIGHIGLHVPDLEEELGFLKKLGATLTATDKMKNGTRVAFVSLDTEKHHSLALFEDGGKIPNGDSRKQGLGIHHIAMPVSSRKVVDCWKKKLNNEGIKTLGPSIQAPEGDGLEKGSGSYSIFFNDPNGICFEIYTGAMTVEEFKASQTNV